MCLFAYFLSLHIFCLVDLITMFLVLQGVSPLIPIDLWWFFNFPIFRAPTFPPFFSIFFPVLMFFLGFCNCDASCFPRCFPIRPYRFVVVVQYSHFSMCPIFLYILFF